MAFSIEYLATLNLCWSREQMTKAMTAANSPKVPTWSWFLGSRLQKMAREDCMQRLAAALTHAQRTRVKFPPKWPHPPRLGAQWGRAQDCTDEELYTYLADLGAVLDAEDTDGA